MMKKKTIYYIFALICMVAGLFMLFCFKDNHPVIGYTLFALLFAAGMIFLYLLDRMKKVERTQELEKTFATILSPETKYFWLVIDESLVKACQKDPNGRNVLQKLKKDAFYLTAYDSQADLAVLKEGLLTEPSDEENAENVYAQCESWEGEFCAVTAEQLASVTGKTFLIYQEDYGVLKSLNAFYYFLQHNEFITEESTQ